MRLIDADALIESIKEELWHWDTVDGINATTVLKQTISDIDNMPTIEIIRCRDCKYNDMPPTAGNACCTLLYGMTNQNGFCHMAERREVSE